MNYDDEIEDEDETEADRFDRLISELETDETENGWHQDCTSDCIGTCRFWLKAQRNQRR